MSETRSIMLTDGERAIVLAIRAAHLPPGAVVHAFGSRATGRARRYSDLDLAITAPCVLTLDETAALNEAFAESDLPWKVDLLDARASDRSLSLAIEQDRRLLFPPQNSSGA